MLEHPTGAILQRDKETYAIVPRTPVGLVTPDDLEALAAVARKYNIPVIKITSGQRFALVGLKKEDVDSIWQELGMDVGKATELCLHYVQACPGTAVCKFGVQDSLGLGTEIESFFTEMELPAKVKIGISGCPFCCGESFVRDIGIFGKKNFSTRLNMSQRNHIHVRNNRGLHRFFGNAEFSQHLCLSLGGSAPMRAHGRNNVRFKLHRPQTLNHRFNQYLEVMGAPGSNSDSHPLTCTNLWPGLEMRKFITDSLGNIF